MALDREDLMYYVEDVGERVDRFEYAVTVRSGSTRPVVDDGKRRIKARGMIFNPFCRIVSYSFPIHFRPESLGERDCRDFGGILCGGQRHDEEGVRRMRRALA